MALNIIWSPRALDNFHEVISYLSKNWSAKVVRNFVSRTEKVIELISEHPEIFKQLTDRNPVREALITKHNLLLYQIQEAQVLLLAVFDTRQNPRKKKIS